MMLYLRRNRWTRLAQFGALYRDHDIYAYTIESPPRHVACDHQVPCVAAGGYVLQLTYSHRAKRDLPLLCGPGAGLHSRIHDGTVEADMSGSILVGDHVEGATLAGGRFALNKIIDLLSYAGDDNTVVLQILNA